MYKRAYYKIFNAITDVLDCENREKMIEILKQAQIDAEEIIISENEEI